MLNIEDFKAADRPRVPVMLPTKTGSSFRVSDGEFLERVLLTYDGNHWYLVTQEMLEEHNMQNVNISNLYHAITNDGQEFLIPVTKGWDGKGSTLSESLTELITESADNWIRRIGVIHGSHEYEIVKLNKKPRFKMTIEECFDSAFKNRVIQNENDLKKLQAKEKKKSTRVVEEIDEE
jgi:hypothetical protein